MTDELSALNFQDDFHEASAVPDAARWSLEKVGPLEVRAVMTSSGHPEEKFYPRLLWTKYPDEAPSLKFVDPATSRLDVPKAWPNVRGFRPGNLDACVNWCSEGLNTHPEWKTDPRYRWDPRGNALLRVLRILQSELDDYFSGRYSG